MFRLEHNAETGEVFEIPLSDEEISEIKKRQEEAAPRVAALQKEKAQKREARSNILEKLGITEEEAKLLLS